MVSGKTGKMRVKYPETNSCVYLYVCACGWLNITFKCPKNNENMTCPLCLCVCVCVHAPTHGHLSFQFCCTTVIECTHKINAAGNDIPAAISSAASLLPSRFLILSSLLRASFSFSVCPPPLPSDLCSSLSLNEMELDLMWFGQSSFIWVWAAHGRLRWSEEQRWETKGHQLHVVQCQSAECCDALMVKHFLTMAKDRNDWDNEPELFNPLVAHRAQPVFKLAGQPLWWRALNFPGHPEGYYIMFPAFKGHSRRLFITKVPYRALYLDDWHIWESTSSCFIYHGGIQMSNMSTCL